MCIYMYIYPQLCWRGGSSEDRGAQTRDQQGSVKSRADAQIASDGLRPQIWGAVILLCCSVLQCVCFCVSRPQIWGAVILLCCSVLQCVCFCVSRPQIWGAVIPAGDANKSRHITDTNEACRTYEWGISHVWMRHFARMKCAFRTFEWGQGLEDQLLHSVIQKRHVTLRYRNEACLFGGWGMSHARTRHVARTNEACHTYEWGMSHVWMRAVIENLLKLEGI